MLLTTPSYSKNGLYGKYAQPNKLCVPKFHLIYACSDNGVIGNKGKIPWHIPEDFKHFRETTMSHPVLMGRKTWDSLPEEFKPLPGRVNFVLSRNTKQTTFDHIQFQSLPNAVEYFAVNGVEDVWVIGGAEIYKHILPMASTVVVTEVHGQFEGDAFAPTLSSEDWKEVSREEHRSKYDAYFSIAKYERINQKILNI